MMLEIQVHLHRALLLHDDIRDGAENIDNAHGRLLANRLYHLLLTDICDGLELRHGNRRPEIDIAQALLQPRVLVTNTNCEHCVPFRRGAATSIFYGLIPKKNTVVESFL